jgi:hypothetical protein
MDNVAALEKPRSTLHRWCYQNWFEECTGLKPTAKNVRKRFSWALPLITRYDWYYMYQWNKDQYPDIHPKPLRRCG